jgi:hypothetical protein
MSGSSPFQRGRASLESELIDRRWRPWDTGGSFRRACWRPRWRGSACWPPGGVVADESRARPHPLGHTKGFGNVKVLDFRYDQQFFCTDEAADDSRGRRSPARDLVEPGSSARQHR